MRDQDIHRTVDVFNKQQEVAKFARMVPLSESEKNDFNLNLPRYIDSQQVEDRQDIEGHLKGGIPQADVDALSRYWDICPGLQKSLFKKNRKGYVNLSVAKSDIKTAIYEHPEFATFIAGMVDHFATWRRKSAKKLKELKELTQGCHPKEVIASLAEGRLHHYLEKPLIDAYDIYQHLMDYWSQVMQDDCYLIATDGWKAEPYRIIETDKKGKQRDEGWACDLVPKPLIVAKYFAKEQAAIEALIGESESVASKLTEIEEDHGGEEGLLAELDKVNKANVTARLKEIKGDKTAKEEAVVLNDWLTLNTQESDLKKQIKDAESALDAKAYAQDAKLDENDVKTLVVDNKWFATLDIAIHGEMDRISQQLTSRVKELAERYEAAMPTLTDRVAELEAKVNGHLERMGFAWN